MEVSLFRHPSANVDPQPPSKLQPKIQNFWTHAVIGSAITALAGLAYYCQQGTPTPPPLQLITHISPRPIAMPFATPVYPLARRCSYLSLKDFVNYPLINTFQNYIWVNTSFSLAKDTTQVASSNHLTSAAPIHQTSVSQNQLRCSSPKIKGSQEPESIDVAYEKFTALQSSLKNIIADNWLPFTIGSIVTAIAGALLYTHPVTAAFGVSTAFFTASHSSKKLNQLVPKVFQGKFLEAFNILPNQLAQNRFYRGFTRALSYASAQETPDQVTEVIDKWLTAKLNAFQKAIEMGAELWETASQAYQQENGVHIEDFGVIYKGATPLAVSSPTKASLSEKSPLEMSFQEMRDTGTLDAFQQALQGVSQLLEDSIMQVDIGQLPADSWVHISGDPFSNFASPVQASTPGPKAIPFTPFAVVDAANIPKMEELG